MPRLRPPRPLLLATLASLAALLAAGCGSEGTPERKLIAQSKAQAMVKTIDRAESALADGRCDSAQNAVARLRRQAQELPESYDARLVANVSDWVDHLEQRVPEDCTDRAEEKKDDDKKETPTPTPTETPEETETPTPTPTVTATPTATATPVPTATATPIPDQGGSGGQGEGGEGGGGDEGDGGGSSPSTGGVSPEDGG
ncbi:MAG TPA: hypothetical protein VF533_16705 [Solirubrobacteraceae bacterium]|jgi:hypothetical protein